ncbi:HAMP domain-containing sensor histidine kinase [Halobacteriovorax sp. BALOs_7]|uniref:sensor histidine kinase n=1 Tax=Halobacteriovorax sp. BALOs_7 TaxID=2109558 RepID=UPI000EA37C22|nr:HAMP domain-containing sensor histidine kinase [Halobacteriovorax sp. BALOs_7]
MEVSNKALNAYFDGIKSMGDSVDEFLYEISMQDKSLTDEKGRISWEDFKLITIAFANRYENYTEIINETGVANKVIKPIFDTITYFVSYSLLFNFFLKLSFKIFYSNVKVSSRKISSDTFHLIFTFDHSDQIFHEFINMYVDLFRTVPMNFLGAKSPSRVKFRTLDNKVIYTVSNPVFAKFSLPNFFYNLFFTKRKYKELILQNIEYSNQLEEQNLELENYRKKLESLNADLNLSNRTLNHDIANKLLSLEFAKKKIKRGDYEQAIDRIDRFSKSVLGIINNSKGRSFKHDKIYEFSEINLYSLLLDSVTEYEDLAHQKGIRIIHDFKIDDNLNIYTNKIALQNNLISNIMYNAIKFSKKNGSIVFSAEVLEEQLYLRIIDFGVGIPQKKIDLIKMNSGAIDSTKGTEGEAGTGHGMSIIMDTAAALGFKVNISSSLDNGTSVELSKNIAHEDNDYSNILFLKN